MMVANYIIMLALLAVIVACGVIAGLGEKKFVTTLITYGAVAVFGTILLIGFIPLMAIGGIVVTYLGLGCVAGSNVIKLVRK